MIGDTLVGCLYMPNGNPAPGPLNSRYLCPVRRKETRARRWDLQFEFTSLQRRVSREPDFLKRLPHPRVTEVRGKQPESVNQHQTGSALQRGLLP